MMGLRVYSKQEGNIMADLILTAEQALVVRQAKDKTIQVRDPAGRLLAEITPEWNQEFIAELKRRAASRGPWFTGAQVQAHLKALEEEWARTGGFDEAYMRAFLDRVHQADPGHYHDERRPS
jgi:uncharacterized protein YmfQ (DUF2313 family)